MSSSTFSCIWNFVAWTTLFVGSIFFLTKVWLILYRTESDMRVYSRILLLSCVTHFLQLMLFFLTQPIISYDNETGSNIVILLGIVQQLPNPWKTVIFFFNISLHFLSMGGVSVQFIYRFLILKRMHMKNELSFSRYLVMFLMMYSFVIAMCILLWMATYPREGCEFLTDHSVRNILATADRSELVMCHRTLYDTWFILFIISVFLYFAANYVIITVIALKMRKYVRRSNLNSVTYIRPTPTSHSFSPYERTISINRQMTIYLSLQALLPLISQSIIAALVIVTILPFKYEAYSNLLIKNLGFLFACYISNLLTPIISILTIQSYRGVLIRFYCHLRSFNQRNHRVEPR